MLYPSYDILAHKIFVVSYNIFHQLHFSLFADLNFSRSLQRNIFCVLCVFVNAYMYIFCNPPKTLIWLNIQQPILQLNEFVISHICMPEFIIHVCASVSYYDDDDVSCESLLHAICTFLGWSWLYIIHYALIVYTRIHTTIISCNLKSC